MCVEGKSEATLRKAVCQYAYQRIEVYRGPDSLDRYTYGLFWMANYHPGHPDGEYRWAERAQIFFCRLPKSLNEYDVTDQQREC